MNTSVMTLTSCRAVVRILSFLLLPFFSYSQTFFDVSSSLADNGSQAGTTATITPPSSMAAGDLVIIYAHFRSTTGTSSITNAGGQAWVTETSGAPGGTNQSFAVFWCRFNGTWAADPVVSGGTASIPLSAIMYVYRPTSGNNSWGIHKVATNSNANAATVSISGVATTVPNTVTMAFWGSPTDNTWGSLTNSTEWSKTGLDAQYRNTSGSGQSHTAAYNIRSTAGNVASVAQTQTTSEKTVTSTITWNEISPPTNDVCSSAIALTSSTSCTNTAGTLVGASYTAIASIGCGVDNRNDVWYSFTAKSTNPTISLTTALANPRVQLFSGGCSGLTSLACGNSTLTAAGLTIGTTYWIRVYTDPDATGTFDICITDPPPPPANDFCANAISLNSNSTCNNISGILNATTTYTTTANACGTNNDVWYSFVAKVSNPTITLSGAPSDTRAQIMAGTCAGGFTAVGACPSSATTTASGLTVGATYYVRVYSASNATGTFNICVTDPPPVTGGRMNEVFRQTTLSGSGVLNYPWEVTYGPDEKLWITEARGYKVDRMDPNTGAKTTVLDLNSTSTDLSAWGADSLRAVNLTSTTNWNTSANAWPQGGLAGLALHPKFLNPDSAFVYISYVHRYLSTAAGSAGIYFRNKLVRFTYNSGTGKLESPIVVCDTLPGGQDHNSQRMIIAPVEKGGPNYLFYASGDMGSGQFSNRMRPQNAQIPSSYEGKILRFNLVPDNDAGAAAWIPDDNPYNTLLGVQSAVYSIGIRNNQGFAYDTSLHILYGSSHGPYSDDEINIIEKKRNYGHPLVIGYVSDGNYNGNSSQSTSTSVSAGAAYTDNSGVSTCPPVGNEANNKTTIEATGNGLYKDPLFSAYAVSQATVTNIWATNPGNGGWPSEGWSGLELYSNSMIPGWKKSLVAASLKWGRLVRIRLGASGTITLPSNHPTNNAGDTISYLGSQNRFRDLAFAPNGKDIFVIMDNSSTTSGPGSANPVVPNCMGCLQRYTFLGYNVNSGSGNRSYIPTSIDIASGKANAFETTNKVVINAANGNTNFWVPITDTSSNIVAEIYAQGHDLDTVTTTVYTKTGASRIYNGKKYLNRHLTISPQKQPGGQVLIRLYISKAEYDQLVTDGGVSAIGNLKIIKNEDSATTVISSNTNLVNTSISEAFGSNGYVLQGDISSFSSFYFSSDVIALPLQFLTFKGALQNNAALLQWETANEINTSHFVVERSIDGSNFSPIGTVTASGNSANTVKYSYIDYKAIHQSATKLYYRLKQVDEDGSFTYSKTITIELNLEYLVSIHPNPIADILKIRLSMSKAQQVHIYVTDMNGHAVYKSSKFVREGNSELPINTKAWPVQMYSVRIIGSDNKPLTIQNVIKL